DQPVPFSHKHHVQGLGLQCQYCHTTVEESSYAGIPPTRTCMNCHAQIWTNAELLQPVRDSWATGQSLVWTKVHDLPDYVYFNHEIHVNKGIGCASCHGRVDEMPLMYAQNSLQMEWCLNCHRDPAKNLRPTSEIYNMNWEKPTENHPVWCSVSNEKVGVPTADSVNCVTRDPATAGPEVASLEMPAGGAKGLTAGMATAGLPTVPIYHKFTSQDGLGHFLLKNYNIRTPRDLTSCEVCHR
ncbi:MAG TPA: cytochrome c3 family protein, partial [Terracidiphilus sp.]|nr:cytochrome c3 family protein [Terracidiphilus sp.]